MVVAYAVTYNLAPIFPEIVQSVWIIPGLTMGKVYSNSMIALLNSRLTIAGGRNTKDLFSVAEIRLEVLRNDVGPGNGTTDVATGRRTRSGDESG